MTPRVDSDAIALEDSDRHGCPPGAGHSLVANRNDACQVKDLMPPVGCCAGPAGDTGGAGRLCMRSGIGVASRAGDVESAGMAPTYV